MGFLRLFQQRGMQGEVSPKAGCSCCAKRKQFSAHFKNYYYYFLKVYVPSFHTQ